MRDKDWKPEKPNVMLDDFPVFHDLVDDGVWFFVTDKPYKSEYRMDTFKKDFRMRLEYNKAPSILYNKAESVGPFQWPSYWHYMVDDNTDVEETYGILQDWIDDTFKSDSVTNTVSQQSDDDEAEGFFHQGLYDASKKSEGLFTPKDIIDPVTKPSHYNQSGIECIAAIKASLGLEGFAAYCKGNVLKYVWRYKYKGGLEDLRKANQYQCWLIETEEQIAREKGNI